MSGMATRRGAAPASLTVRQHQGLVGVVVIENGHQATRFFADETEAVEPKTDAGTQAALRAIGAWADLDWDEAVEELDRIRHASPPSPPLDL